MPEAAKAQRPEILLITDNKTVLLELGHDGKFSAKSASWEENKVILPGDEIGFGSTAAAGSSSGGRRRAQ
jgi:hypothetical protein